MNLQEGEGQLWPYLGWQEGGKAENMDIFVGLEVKGAPAPPPDLRYLRVGLVPEGRGEETMRGFLLTEEPPESSESGRVYEWGSAAPRSKGRC